MNPLGVLMDELNKNGVSMELKKQMNDGSLQSTRPGELATINTKARIATTAQLLKNLNKEEKIQWAIQTKDEGNELYRSRNFSGAIDKYMETLSAADFGKEDKSEGNVDILLIPILCNLAACCMQLQQWHKVILFAEQALNLRPKCQKAKLRQGMGYLNTGEPDLAIKCFEELIEMTQATAVSDSEGVERTTTSEAASESGDLGLSNSMDLTATDIAKLPKLLLQAKHYRKRQKEALKSQKEALKKAFQSSSVANEKSPDHTTPIGENGTQRTSAIEDKLMQTKKPIQPETTLEYIVVFIALVVKSLYLLFTRHVNKAEKKDS